jgi:sulfofructose kinase
VVVISGPLKTRAISNRPGPRLNLVGNAAGKELIEAASWVHVDQHGWGTVRSHLDQMKTPPRLSVDAGNTIANYRPANTALYAPTHSALRNRYYDFALPNDISSLLTRAVADGAHTAVATSGGDGSFALARDGVLIHAPAPSATIVSTLGAGDVFHGALLAGLILAERGALSDGFEHVLAYATVVASLSCRGIDGRSAIPTHGEAIRTLELMPINQKKGAVR